MPSVWDGVDEKVEEAVANTAGVPFPERLPDMAAELTFDVAAWAAEGIWNAISTDANAGFDPGAPPDPAFAGTPPPDPPDAGATDPAGAGGGGDGSEEGGGGDGIGGGGGSEEGGGGDGNGGGDGSEEGGGGDGGN